MADYGDGDFDFLEERANQSRREYAEEEFQNSKILTELEVFDELELRLFYDPRVSKHPLRYSIKDGVIIVLDELNTHKEDDVYQIFTDYQDFEDFMFEYFEPQNRDFETVYELLTTQEVITTLVRCKPAKYVFV